MEELSSVAGQATETAGQPPAELNTTITRTHSMQVAGYMVAASNGQVADIAAAITAFDAEDLQSGYTTPITQFPYGWAPSEVFYNVPALGDTQLNLSACAVAGILVGDIDKWNDPVLKRLNPEADLPDLDITLVYLNLSMPITLTLTQYLTDNCKAWKYGVLDNLGEVVADVTNLMPSTDVEYNWRAVNATEGAVCIGASMPVGKYVAQYPAAMQYAALEVADGEFVEPTGELNATAVAELVKLAPAAGDASAGWSAFNSISSPGRYPVCYWGFATLASDLTAEGARGLYIRDVAGHLLTPEGQELVGTDSDEYPLPKPLMPAALDAWASIKTAASDVVTGIPVPVVAESAAPAPTPAPAPGSGAAGMAAGAPLLAAALAAVLMLA
ncbi:hypothetical protein COHA_009511 [Chlorella ohadii]|uniref:PBP domain-containing protein n=1 Tax=Chlorella ohadii TaxID=2649997 RepID=A0AAD5DI55_9CHLO|nr:hypothetical protein COHA_009511 [Chlorella ohadii]